MDTKNKAASADDAALIEKTPFPSAEASKCPYPYYKALRSNDPIHRLESGEYVISRHADIMKIILDADTFSSRHSMFNDGWMRPSTLEDLANPNVPWGIVNSDGAMHTTKRLLAMEMVKPERLKRYVATIEKHTDELIDTFIERGACDFVAEFADLLPPKVIIALFDLPQSDLDRVLQWGRYEGFGMRYARPDKRAAGREGIIDLGKYIYDKVIERQDNLGDDELSGLMRRHIEHHGKIDMPNFVAEASNLFIGGVITTTHLLANLMTQFVKHPDQQEKARQNPEMLKNAIEEALRLDAPVQLGIRMVTKDTEVNGHPFKAGDHLIIVWGSGNRDAEVFQEPEEFNIERPNLRAHVAFGGGEHLCLGARLGRLETTIAFEHIFARMTNIRFAPGANDFENIDTVIFRGPHHLKLEFDRP